MNTPPRPQSPRVHPGAVLLSSPSNAFSYAGSNNFNGSVSYSQQPSLNEMIESAERVMSPTPSHSHAQGAVLNTNHHHTTSGGYMDGFASPLQAPFETMDSMNPLMRPAADSTGAAGTNNMTTGGLLGSSTVVNFTQDVNQLIFWMEKLSVAQQNTVMDNLLSSLSEEVLQYTKLKLDSLINTGYMSPSPIGSPILMANSLSTNNNVINGFDLNGAGGNHNVLSSFAPLEATMSAPAMAPGLSIGGSTAAGVGAAAFAPPQMNSLDFIMNVNEEPLRRVGSNNGVQKSEQMWSPRAISPSHTTELNNSSIYDYLVEQRPRSADPYKQATYTGPTSAGASPKVKHGSKPLHANYSGNNSSGAQKSASATKASQPQVSGAPSLGGSKKASSGTTTTASANTASSGSNTTGASAPASTGSGSTQNQAMQPENLTDPELLQNIPLWLKSLRLHKYTENLKHYAWEDLVLLDDAALQKEGIAALGARNKLLKAFKVVIECKERGAVSV